jgi:hypothetical protein
MPVAQKHADGAAGRDAVANFPVTVKAATAAAEAAAAAFAKPASAGEGRSAAEAGSATRTTVYRWAP